MGRVRLTRRPWFLWEREAVMKADRLEKLYSKAAWRAGAFCADRRGSVLTLAAFALPVMVGFVGLGLDASSWYAQKRQVQGIADAAAVAGAVEKLSGSDDATVSAAITKEAVRNGYVAGGGNQLTPDLTESTPVVGSTRTVSVVVRQEADVNFASLFLDEVFVAAQAAAGTRQTGTFCVIALNETEANAIKISGTGQANVGCGVVSNSCNMSYAFSVIGNAELTANPAQACGMMDVKKELTNFHSDYPLMPLSPQAPDPFEGTLDNIAIDKPATCDIDVGDITTGDATLTIGPAVAGGSYRICGSGELTLHNDFDFEPGTYFLDGVGLRMNSTTVVTGDEVSIILTGDDAADVGSITINGSASVDLSSGDSTLYPGIVIGVDPIANDVNNVHRFNGGSTMTLNGVIYVPGESVDFQGGADVVDGCTQIIAQKVEFTGNSFIENEVSACQDLGTTVGGFQNQIVLIE